MVRTVVAGLDGSPESRAAVEWAAREAELHGLPLKIVHAWEPVPDPIAQAPSSAVRPSSTGARRSPARPGRASNCAIPDSRS